MPKLQFDTSRYCHNNAGRMGKWQGQDVAGLIGDEVKALKEEVAALKVAAEALISDVDEYFRCADIGESRDKLAALVGEVER